MGPALRILTLALAAGLPLLAQQPTPAVPEATRADLTQARQLVREGKLTEVERLLQEMEPQFPRDPALLLLRGEVLLALGQTAPAITLLTRAVELAPTRARAHFQLGSALATSGDAVAAIDAYGRAIENTQDAEMEVLAHLNRALLLQQKSRGSEAAAELEAVLGLQPGKHEVYGDLAMVYLEAGRLDDAQRTLDRGRAAGFASARHYTTLGSRLYQERHHQAAESAFRVAIELDPGSAEAERSLATALEQQGKVEEALRRFARYLELAPSAPDAKEIAAKLKSAQGRAKAP